MHRLSGFIAGRWEAVYYTAGGFGERARRKMTDVGSRLPPTSGSGTFPRRCEGRLHHSVAEQR